MKQIPFQNTYCLATMETGINAADRGSVVTTITGDDGRVVLLRVDTRSLTIYLDLNTARGLSLALDRAVRWVEDPGGEVNLEAATDRWSEDVRAGAIGGRP